MKNQDIWVKFSNYPSRAYSQLQHIENMIFSLAKVNGLGKVKTSLKWGEASYLVEGGSAIRIDWKNKQPSVVKVMFHCQTSLVSTFKELYPNAFHYEGNRAVLVPLSASVTNSPLAECILLALTYKHVKHLPLLGALPIRKKHTN